MRITSADAVRALPESPPAPTTASTGAADASTFGGLVSQAIGQANALDARASDKMAELATGASEDIHGTMIALKEADISIKLVGTIRNQLLDAFHELWRTNV